jgi:hypothetical protein
VGEATVRRPVVILSQIAGAFGNSPSGDPIAGLIGLGDLLQFRVTIDYAAHVLELGPRGGSHALAAGATAIPLWLMGSHTPIIPAVAMARDTTLVILDTGEGGVLFAPGPALRQRLGIVVDSANAQSAMGAGGALQVTPFLFGALSVGPVSFPSMMSVAGVFGAVNEQMAGVTVGGLVAGFFFSGQRITLDFDAMQLVIAAK